MKLIALLIKIEEQTNLFARNIFYPIVTVEQSQRQSSYFGMFGKFFFFNPFINPLTLVSYPT